MQARKKTPTKSWLQRGIDGLNTQNAGYFQDIRPYPHRYVSVKKIQNFSWEIVANCLGLVQPKCKTLVVCCNNDALSEDSALREVFPVFSTVMEEPLWGTRQIEFVIKDTKLFGILIGNAVSCPPLVLRVHTGFRFPLCTTFGRWGAFVNAE